MSAVNAAPLRAAAGATAVSCLLIVPCFWQPAIQAGDLASHIYNAWLFRQIHSGGLEGLAIVPRFTNMLFDSMLTTLWNWVGPDMAQRIAVAASVLVFFWGTFAFISTIARRRAWELMPVLAIFSYGSVFQIGFFNFIIAVGLTSAAAGLAMGCARWKWWAVIPLVVVAAYAHVLPVPWIMLIAGYVHVARNATPGGKLKLLAGAVSAVLVGHVLLTRVLDNPVESLPISVISVFALDSVALYAPHYRIVIVLVLFAWGTVILEQRKIGAWLVQETAGHVLLLSALVALLTPHSVQFPGYSAAMTYMSLRTGLFSAIAWCALAAAAGMSRIRLIAGTAAAAFFFFFFWGDQAAANRLESTITKATSSIPQGARVAALVISRTERTPILHHTIDRACIERCFSYLNYEPPSHAFRVVATRENPYVISNAAELPRTAYLVRPRDVPLYEIRVAGDLQSASVREAKPGDQIPLQKLDVFPSYW